MIEVKVCATRLGTVTRSVSSRSSQQVFRVGFRSATIDRALNVTDNATFSQENVRNGAMCDVLVIPLDQKNHPPIGLDVSIERCDVEADNEHCFV